MVVGLLVMVNVCVFLVMALGMGPTLTARDLLQAGGNLGRLTLNGQEWRLFTATYLHAGFGHLFGNMVLLWLTGRFLEQRVGPVWFFIAYTVTGICASLASAWGHPTVVSVGASGSIAGLLGILVALFGTGRNLGVSGAWLSQTILINAVYSFTPSVDWLAHLGGFVAGLACGVLLGPVIGPDPVENEI